MERSGPPSVVTGSPVEVWLHKPITGLVGRLSGEETLVTATAYASTGGVVEIVMFLIHLERKIHEIYILTSWVHMRPSLTNLMGSPPLCPKGQMPGNVPPRQLVPDLHGADCLPGVPLLGRFWRVERHWLLGRDGIWILCFVYWQWLRSSQGSHAEKPCFSSKCVGYVLPDHEGSPCSPCCNIPTSRALRDTWLNCTSWMVWESLDSSIRPADRGLCSADAVGTLGVWLTASWMVTQARPYTALGV